MADLDEAAARRAEKQVATLFAVSIVGTLVFIVCYFAIDLETTGLRPGHRRRRTRPTSSSASPWLWACSASASARCTGPRP